MNKRIILSLLFALLFPWLSLAQGKPDYVGQWYQRTAQGKRATAADLFSKSASDYTRTKRYNLRANANQLNSILQTAPPLLDLVVPYGDKTYTLNLARVEVVSETFGVRTNAGNASFNKGVQYRGIVNNNPAHIASLSLQPGDIMGFFSTTEGNFTITKEGLEFIVYNDHDFPTPEGLILCSTQDPTGYQIPSSGGLVSGIGCKTVNVYMECDYAFYQNKGSSTTNVANYVIAFFNEVATLYANENIAIQISQIFVWTQPDPYVSYTTTNNVLTAFKANRGTTYNGDIAHFLTTRNLGGGVAYVNVLCNKAYAYGVSMIYSTYNTAPTYSWTVEVVTHEIGHNLGSPHTHSCSWSTGALDNCYTPEGSCAAGPAPTNGGTIMSYCHLSSTGINFNNGFGYEPGNLIRSRVLNAACLASGSATAPSGLTTTNITTSSATLNWVAVSGATNYTVEYRPSASSTWTSLGTTSGTSTNVTGLAANTAYTWHVKSDCSGYSTDATFTTTGVVETACEAPTSLATTSVTTTSATLTWSPVSGATSYTVQYTPSVGGTSATVTTTTNTVTISGLSAGTSYSWQVKANCSPYSATAPFTTTANPPSGSCAKATGLISSGVTTNSATLSWTAPPSALNYVISVKKAGTSKITTYTTSATSITVSGLQKRTRYEWMVDTKCTDASSSGYTGVAIFTTQ
jgi:hypothetical protein